MKKILTFFLVIAILLTTFCGCGFNKQVVETESGEKIAIKSTGKKIKGEIYNASAFSNGLAFVELSEEQGKTYCIDKKGNIIFELDIDLSVAGRIDSKFINGLAYINEGICDTSGEITKPEDVGATSFIFAPAISAGYIFAEVVKSDYSNTVKKLGILNTKFEWTVEPSEKLYNEFTDEYGNNKITNAYLYYTVGDYFYDIGLNKALNLKTGEVVNGKPKEMPKSSQWVLVHSVSKYTGYCISGETSDIVLDLTTNGEVYSASPFVNGKAAIVYRNTSANKYYVTMIDETGKHLFEPVETKYFNVQTDGKYILVSDDGNGTADYAETFNDKGEKLGEIDVSEDTKFTYKFTLNDGVVLVQGGTKKAYYLDINCNNLF